MNSWFDQKFPSDKDLNIKMQIKVEINNLLELCIRIEKETPLIFEGERVIEFVQNIDEFFWQVEDDLTEVKKIMITLFEFVQES